MTQEALKELLEAVEAAIQAGDWKVDGACDPDLAIRRAKEALAHCPDCGQLLGDAGHIHTCSPQRTWVGLTDEDRKAAFESMPDMLDGFLKTWGWLHFSKALEAKLKQKNGYAEEKNT